MLFADDLQIYSSFFPTDFAWALSAFNRNVNAVSAWATANGLLLNKAKTQPNLDSGAHVKQVVKRVHRVLYSLRHHRKALPRPISKELVEALIFPHFDYACAVYNDLFQYQELKLQRALNVCVRYVVDRIGWMDHVMPHRLALGWLSTARRGQYFIASIVYTAISFKNPSYLLPRFTSVTQRSSKRLPQRSLLIAKKEKPAPSNLLFTTQQQT
ncbi:hypothetical protein TKK_0003475 [Trichogramma kaykai]